jgi:hypothetical protein
MFAPSRCSVKSIMCIFIGPQIWNHTSSTEFVGPAIASDYNFASLQSLESDSWSFSRRDDHKRKDPVREASRGREELDTSTWAANVSRSETGGRTPWFGALAAAN